MVSKQEFQVKNGFRVHEFLLKVEADYLFSKSNSEDFYKLLNTDVFGQISQEDVDKLIEGESKVVVLNNDTLKMQAYNIDEDLLVNTFLGMI